MESAVTVMTLLAVLLFSVACSVLIEEVIFGGLSRIVAARSAVRPRNDNEQ
jgi:HAMP domain-containing protein